MIWSCESSVANVATITNLCLRTDLYLVVVRSSVSFNEQHTPAATAESI